MIKKVLSLASAVFTVKSLISCDVTIPELTNPDVQGAYTLTPAWEKEVDMFSAPVNPKDLKIKKSGETSRGVVSIELTGEIDCGIPLALRKILLGENADVPYGTDYAVFDPLTEPTLNGSPFYKHYYYEFKDKKKDVYGNTVTDTPLENIISLKTLSESSEYSAVTITGITTIYDSKFSVTETNPSLRLLTQIYTNNYLTNSLFSTAGDTMKKTTQYSGTNPNYFSYNVAFVEGYYPVPGPSDSTRDYPKNGMSFLMWNGPGTEKKARVSTSLAKKDFEISWEDVTFKNVPVQYAAWYIKRTGELGAAESVTLPSFPDNAAVDPMPTGDVSSPVTEITIAINVTKSGGSGQIDNFVTPSFYPANSNQKRVFLGEGSVRTTGGYNTEKGDGTITASLEDRIKLVFYNVASGSYDMKNVAYIDTYPPPDYALVSVSLSINVTMTVPDPLPETGDDTE